MPCEVPTWLRNKIEFELQRSGSLTPTHLAQLRHTPTKRQREEARAILREWPDLEERPAGPNGRGSRFVRRSTR